MPTVKRSLNYICVLLLCNIVFLWRILPSLPARLMGLIVLVIWFIWLSIVPLTLRDVPKKLRMLGCGCELLLISAVCTILELFIYIYFGLGSPFKFDVYIWVFNTAVSIILLASLLADGLIRLFFSAGQITVGERLALILLWWVPGINIAVFARVYKKAHNEYGFRVFRLNRNKERRDAKVCGTKYPILLVHGIFFRDWKLFNYWGRIPKELEENGAKIYYGKQQSSSAVEESAGELAKCILNIVGAENCGKVNIIAHSKGGLDSRYAISCLGMDQYVASLTTVNTPHRGCRFARKALDNLPVKLVSSISKKYDRIFSKLGDDQPDFFTGVSDLTDEKCAELNEKMPDCEGVLYQSFGSKMKSAQGAAFPLSLGYSIVNAIDGENDGLVATGSMPWGNFTLLEPAGKRGISHGDVIDLTRKDIEGFDVCELYVGIVRGLKEKGL